MIRLFRSRKVDEMASVVAAQRAELTTVRATNKELEGWVVDLGNLVTLHEQYDRVRDELKACDKDTLAHNLTLALTLMGEKIPSASIRAALDIMETDKATSLNDLPIVDLPTRRDD